jgi:hypothetical protein
MILRRVHFFYLTGDHFSLGGKHTMAIDAWREELQNLSGN